MHYNINLLFSFEQWFQIWRLQQILDSFHICMVYPLIAIWARFPIWKAAKGCINARLARLELQIVGRSFNHLAVKNKRFLLILLCAMAFQGNLHRALVELCATTWTSHLHVVDRYHLIHSIHSISFHSILPSFIHSLRMRSHVRKIGKRLDS